MKAEHLWKMDAQADNVVDQNWGPTYHVDPFTVVNHPQNHYLEFVKKKDTRVECIVPTQKLKDWQRWLSRQSTVFELAQRIVVNNDIDNVIRMKNILCHHYERLIKKQFPSNLSYAFQQEIKDEGTHYYHFITFFIN